MTAPRDLIPGPLGMHGSRQLQCTVRKDSALARAATMPPSANKAYCILSFYQTLGILKL